MCITVQIGERGKFTDEQIGEHGKQRVKMTGDMNYFELHRVVKHQLMLFNLMDRKPCRPTVLVKRNLTLSITLYLLLPSDTHSICLKCLSLS